mmetsp:Transcript_48790/g.153128  ORF Transcript_48790/g.153128 Transcript_48790/m.153128 type:complete len:216 (+) Transcript_48790:291-938(+)
MRGPRCAVADHRELPSSQLLQQAGAEPLVEQLVLLDVVPPRVPLGVAELDEDADGSLLGDAPVPHRLQQVRERPEGAEHVDALSSEVLRGASRVHWRARVSQIVLVELVWNAVVPAVVTAGVGRQRAVEPPAIVKPTVLLPSFHPIARRSLHLELHPRPCALRASLHPVVGDPWTPVDILQVCEQALHPLRPPWSSVETRRVDRSGERVRWASAG